MEGLSKFDNLVYYDGVKFKKSAVNVNSTRYICCTCSRVSIKIEKNGSYSLGNNTFHQSQKCVRIGKTEFACVVEYHKVKLEAKRDKKFSICKSYGETLVKLHKSYDPKMVCLFFPKKQTYISCLKAIKRKYHSKKKSETAVQSSSLVQPNHQFYEKRAFEMNRNVDMNQDKLPKFIGHPIQTNDQVPFSYTNPPQNLINLDGKSSSETITENNSTLVVTSTQWSSSLQVEKVFTTTFSWQPNIKK